MDKVIGRSWLPSLKDRISLPYVEAAIMEIQRIASIVPMSIPRASARDTQLLGYDIPQGTVIIPHVWGILHDDNLWTNPHEFDPTRFLDEKGTVIRREELRRFSLGKYEKHYGIGRSIRIDQYLQKQKTGSILVQVDRK